MYCPQCGNEATSGVQFCRTCGANLKVIGKAVSLSEAIARSDRGPLPKIKEMMKNLKVEHVTEEVSAALEKMNAEITRVSGESHEKTHSEVSRWRRKKTPAERREQQISRGLVSFFSGIGLTVFLYYLSAAIVLKLPPDVIAKIPFELESVVRVIWLIGLIPMTSGLGHILSGLLIRVPKPELPSAPPVERLETLRPAANNIPHSVTDHTTELLAGNSIREQ
jgi:hypothetical protein